MHFFATCKLGLEATVTRQLRDLGIEVLRTEDARVDFQGDYGVMARSLLWLRTAERVLMEVGSFPASSFDELFEGTRSLPWKQYLALDSGIHVNGKSAKSALFSVSDCQSIVKKAIVENLKAAYRTQFIPETGGEVIVEVGLLRDTATIALDCCGAGLSRRGYRSFNVPAPLSETLGAAVVLLSRYGEEDCLVDPMCGSGTMPIEAALIAQNRAPGLNRGFAAENWAFVPQDAFPRARQEAMDSVKNNKLHILGSDMDSHCVDLSKKHAKKAGIMVDWAVRPLSGLVVAEERGIFVCNPPYGRRLMDKKEAEGLVSQMRRVFSQYPGWSQNIISGMGDFEKTYGRRADKRRKLSNGGMQCMLYQYFGDRKQ